MVSNPTEVGKSQTAVRSSVNAAPCCVLKSEYRASGDTQGNKHLPRDGLPIVIGDFLRRREGTHNARTSTSVGVALGISRGNLPSVDETSLRGCVFLRVTIHGSATCECFLRSTPIDIQHMQRPRWFSTRQLCGHKLDTSSPSVATKSKRQCTATWGY